MNWTQNWTAGWKKAHRKIMAAAIVIALMAPCAAGATTILALSLDDLIFDADAVVHARVLSQHSYRQPDGRVVTRVELHIERYLVGEGPQTLSLRVLGGQIGNMVTRVIGAPVFSEGHESVLFLRQLNLANNPTMFRLVGMTQGQFNLQTDQVTHRKFVVRDLLDVSILGEAQTHTPTHTQTSTSQWTRPDVSLYMPYDSFIDVIVERAQILR